MLLAIGPPLCRAYPGLTPRGLDAMTLREIHRYLEYLRDTSDQSRR